MKGLNDFQKLAKEKSFFVNGNEVFVGRAPGRLDVMGGVADYSGSLVLQLPIAEAAWAGVQLSHDGLLKIVSVGADRPKGETVFEMEVELLLGMGYETAVLGAKITGGDSGGTVAVLTRKAEGETAVQRIAGEYVARQYAGNMEHCPYIFKQSSDGAVAFGTASYAPSS